jgi:hypothetical protein
MILSHEFEEKQKPFFMKLDILTEKVEIVKSKLLKISNEKL